MNEEETKEIHYYLSLIMDEFNCSKLEAIDKLKTTAVNQKNEKLVKYLFYYKKSLMEKN